MSVKISQENHFCQNHNFRRNHPQSTDYCYPSVPIGDFENEQQDRTAALFQCRDRFPNGPFGERTLHSKGSCPPRALLTVFSTTQLKHFTAHCKFMPQQLYGCLHMVRVGWKQKMN